LLRLQEAVQIGLAKDVEEQKAKLAEAYEWVLKLDEMVTSLQEEVLELRRRSEPIKSKSNLRVRDVKPFVPKPKVREARAHNIRGALRVRWCCSEER